MAAPKSQNEDLLLKNLVPLNTLTDDQLTRLSSQVLVEKAKRGEYLFREGDTDHQNIYLLSGTVSLLSGQAEIDTVSSGTQTARFALAHQLPRKHSARAIGPVTYVRIDSRLLSNLLARSETASYEVDEAGVTGKGDWMSLLLESPVFQQIPPANLQRVMMRMTEMSVAANDVIIRQGDDGDYFYLISRGLCRVTRRPSPDHPPVELAQLKTGAGFGEESLITDKPRSSTVTMLTDGELMRLSKQDFVELVKQPVSNDVDYEQACRLVEDGALWIDVRAPEEYEAAHLPGAINLPFYTLRFQATSLADDRSYLIYGVEVGQSATAAYLLMERGFEIAVLKQDWHEIVKQAGLSAEPNETAVDNIIEFNRDKEVADVADADRIAGGSDQSRLEFQRILDETRQSYETKLNQLQAEQRSLQQTLQEAEQSAQRAAQAAQKDRESLEQELRQLQDGLVEAEDKLTGYQTLEKSERKLKQRIKELTGKLNQQQEALKGNRAEAEKAKQSQQRLEQTLALAQQGQTQNRQQAETEIASMRQALAELETKHGALQDELQGLQQAKDAQNSDQARLQQELMQLQNELQAAKVELQRRESALESAEQTITELRRASSDHVKESDRMQQRLQAAQQDRVQSKRQRDEIQRQLEQSRHKAVELEQQLKTVEEGKEALEQTLSETRQRHDTADATQRATLASLEAELEDARARAQANQEALQETKQELNNLDQERAEMDALLEQERQRVKFLQRSLKTAEDAVEISETTNEENQREIDRLRQRLNEQQSETEGLNARNGELEQQHRQAVEAMQKEVSALRRELEHAENRRHEQDVEYKQELERLRTVKAELETRQAQLQDELRTKERDFDASTVERRHRIEQLEQDLLAAKAQLESNLEGQSAAHDTQQELQRALQEIDRLNKTIDGLREVQLEMESQLSQGPEEELQTLRSALEAEARKRRDAEALTRQLDVLRREREVQETAVEMLGEDLENLGHENAQLATEKESLTQQLSAIHGQLHELQGLNRSLEAKTQQLQAQASDPESADDLLSQLEDWRSKADIYQFERDEAQTALKQMEQETKQLRSAIEIYVAQIQQDGTIDFSDELKALHSELDMVRRQAAQDMHRMQKRLAGVKASEAGERDVDTAASLQALRQEMDSVHLALNEKEHVLRTSQTQCHKLEDAIEDRDKEIDHLRRKLESLLRKTGDYDAHTEPPDTAGSGDSELDREASGSLPQQHEKQAVKAVMTADGDNLRSPLGRIFRKR